MKKLLLLLSFLSIIYCAKAQYVTIPDAHFVTFLQTNFPGCMVGNQMDTTCAAITSATTLNCANDSIADLTGVEYFDGLQILHCENNLLTTYPTLPNTITYFKCSYNQFTTLPSLPNSLQILWCNNNQLTSLPSLPNSLNFLYCYFNQLVNLPVLPNSLYSLQCDNNQITSLPMLPPMLGSLICYQNQLTSLPAIPSSLNGLDCANNHLSGLPTFSSSFMQVLDFSGNLFTSFPIIPDTVWQLGCSNNQLTSLSASLPYGIFQLVCRNNSLGSLPALPNTLKNLACDGNQLTNLPSLPTSLYFLQCYNNQLISLPPLPNSMYGFLCQNNNISCFPIFPNSLIQFSSFDISNNPFTCLPNYVSAMDSITLAYPLCSAGNANACPFAQGIIGYTYKDNNSDCLYSTLDSTKRNIHERLYDSTGTLIDQTYSAMNGVYDFPQPTGTYTVKIDTTGYPYDVQCPHPGIDSIVVLTNALPIQTNVDFDIGCKPGFDIGAQSIVKWGNIFPGQIFKIRCITGDLSNWYGLHCATGISGQVVITVTGPVTYMNSLAGTLTPSVAGNVFTYTVANFGTISSSTAFGLVFTTNSNAQNGDVICFNITVTPTAGDNNTSNNTFNYCYTVVNSFDPNYKETYPERVSVGYDDYFYYTVHFQNTGTAPAININLQDTLDANLDLNTFQIINYSHYCTSLLTGNKLSFNFPNIQLPDSSSNFDGSQGFVQYRIKPIASLPLGTQIHNTASIYFDYNAPVVTNTTINEYIGTVGTSAIENQQSIITIFPNPFTEQTTIAFSQEQKNTTIKITDIIGKEIKTINFSGKLCTIEKGTMNAGVYFVRIEDENKNIVNRKIIVQ